MMDQILQMGIFGLIVILGSLAFFLATAVGLPILLYHRREMMKMQIKSKRERGVEERLDELEKRCERLEETTANAHILIADEQRQLDRKLEKKLTTLLPDPQSPREDSSRRRGRRSREAASE